MGLAAFFLWMISVRNWRCNKACSAKEEHPACLITPSLDSDSVLTFGQRLEAEVCSADLALVSLGNLWAPGQETSSVDISEI